MRNTILAIGLLLTGAACTVEKIPDGYVQMDRTIAASSGEEIHKTSVNGPVEVIVVGSCHDDGSALSLLLIDYGYGLAATPPMKAGDRFSAKNDYDGGMVEIRIADINNCQGQFTISFQ